MLNTRGTHATTIRMPRPLYEIAKKLVDAEQAQSSSLNEFFVSAVEAHVKLCERRRIDAEFALMADDHRYHEEAKLIAHEFEGSDAEALALSGQ